MRKRRNGIKLSRGQAARKALYRSLIRALVEHGSIETTEVKAKSLEKKVAKLVTLAKVNDVVAKRKAYSYLGNDRETTDKLFKKVKENYLKRKGGYTKIVKLSQRRGDGARLARLEWIKETVKKEENKSDKAKSKSKPSKTKKK